VAAWVAVEGWAWPTPWAVPALRLGREGIAFAGVVGVRPREGDPVGAPVRGPLGIIKSTFKGSLGVIKWFVAAARPGSSSARILQNDVRDGRSQL
jgi:hypothetical protein